MLARRQYGKSLDGRFTYVRAYSTDNPFLRAE